MTLNNQSDFETKQKQLIRIANNALPGKQDSETCRNFSLSLAELSSRCNRVSQLINDMLANIASEKTATTHDDILTELVELKIELFDEIASWMKVLKTPLNEVISAFPEEIGKEPIITSKVHEKLNWDQLEQVWTCSSSSQKKAIACIWQNMSKSERRFISDDFTNILEEYVTHATSEEFDINKISFVTTMIPTEILK